MGASSVTGTGLGSSGKPTIIPTSGPVIYAAGSVLIEENNLSPPSSPPSGEITVVTLPFPLPGMDSYAIILTGEEGMNPYIASMMDDDDFSLTGFSVGSSAAGTVYYMVIKKGFKLL